MARNEARTPGLGSFTPRRLLAAVCLLLIVTPSTINADLMLAFDPNGSIVEFTVDVGQTVEVPVYLVQSGTPQLNGDLTADGIVSMGVQLNYDTDSGSAFVNSIVQAGEFFEFQESVIDAGQGSAAMTGAVGFQDSAVTGSSVFLGTFTIQGTTAANVTMLSATSPVVASLSGPYFVSGSSLPIALDSSIFSTPAITMVTTSAFVLGDVNQDGVANLLDIDPFVELLNNGTFQIEADTNQDGSVNLLDVDSFIVILSGG